MSVKPPIKPVNLICVRKPVKQTVKTPEEKKIVRPVKDNCKGGARS